MLLYGLLSSRICWCSLETIQKADVKHQGTNSSAVADRLCDASCHWIYR